MPLESPPARGFAEYQRTSPQDSPILYGHGDQVKVSPEVAGPFDVSRWAYVGGWDQAIDQELTALFSWSGAAVGGGQLGARVLNLSQLIPTPAQYRLVNLGPFLTVQWSSVGGGNFHHAVQLIASNRSHPLELIPESPVLVDQQNVAINATTTDTYYPTDYYAGPLQVTCLGTQAGTIQALYLTTAGVWNILYLATFPANVWQAFTITVPMGAWRIQTRNTSGVAGNFYTIATPNSTGSS